MTERMTDFSRGPGAIDDPDMKGGPDVDPRTTPPGDTAGNTATAEPRAAELELPGPDDPVAWSYVQPGTLVVGPNDEEIGRVEQMLGTEGEGIFHGVAVAPAHGGTTRVIPADDVTFLSPSKVETTFSVERLSAADDYQPLDVG